MDPSDLDPIPEELDTDPYAYWRDQNLPPETLEDGAQHIGGFICGFLGACLWAGFAAYGFQNWQDAFVLYGLVILAAAVIGAVVSYYLAHRIGADRALENILRGRLF